jgi:hypothetical protein
MSEVKDKQYTWWFVKRFKTGHRYWFDYQSRRYSVADISGDFSYSYGRPHQTDDGALWLDPSRSISVLFDTDAKSDRFFNCEASIPAVSERSVVTLSKSAADSHCSFLASGDELKWLVHEFNWPIHDGFSTLTLDKEVPRRRRQPEPRNFCRKHFIKES